jgi:hypothetical protein
VNPPWQGGLAQLWLRRNASPALLALAVLLAGALCLVDWSAPATMLAGEPSPAAARALLRQGIWTAYLLVLGPVLLAKSAGVVAAWRAGEGDWLASSPLPRASLLASAWLGGALASGMMLALPAAVAEIRAAAGWPEGPTSAWTVARSLPMPGVVLLEPTGQVAWRVEVGELPPDCRVRLHLLLAGGGPKADVRFSVRRGSGAPVEIRRRISTRTELTLPVPPGPADEPLVFQLARLGPGSIVVADETGLELLEPVTSERFASGILFLRSWLALASAQALALGLGAWMGAATATASVLCACLCVWLASEPSALWPWAGLTRAIGAAGESLVPPWPPIGTWIGAALAIAIGLGLGAAGLRSWRRGA